MNSEDAMDRTMSFKQAHPFRVPLDKDRRLFMPQHFHSQGFEKAYKRRTAVERVNSRLDNVHGFENTALRSQDRIALRVGLVMLVMLASAKAFLKSKKVKTAA